MPCGPFSPSTPATPLRSTSRYLRTLAGADCASASDSPVNRRRSLILAALQREGVDVALAVRGGRARLEGAPAGLAVVSGRRDDQRGEGAAALVTGAAARSHGVTLAADFEAHRRSGLFEAEGVGAVELG